MRRGVLLVLGVLALGGCSGSSNVAAERQSGETKAKALSAELTTGAIPTYGEVRTQTTTLLEGLKTSGKEGALSYVTATVEALEHEGKIAPHSIDPMMSALKPLLVGVGGITSNQTGAQIAATLEVASAPVAHELAAQFKERAAHEAAERRAKAAQARREAREAAVAKRTEVAEQAHEAAEQRATESRERGEREAAARKQREHEWAPATRDRFIGAVEEAAPHGESTARWRAIGECAVKELESQYTEAEIGSSSFHTAEVEDGVKCGEKTP